MTLQPYTQCKLADKGSPLWTIWFRADATAQEQHAARELASFLSQIVGAPFPLLCGEVPPQSAIIVGDPGMDSFLGKEGYHIQVEAEAIRIHGGHPRGTLYGVYSFLELLGCRWFSSTVSHIPRQSTLYAPCVDTQFVPPLEYREILYQDAKEANFCLRNKLNGHFCDLDAVRGGKIEYYPFVHTFDSLLPAEEHFDAHPEYYSLVDGERLREKTQLCLTNPDVLRLCIEQLERWIAAHPDATIFSISQNDCYNPCECPACRAIDEAEGSHAGSLIQFVNAIAEAIEARHPHIVIDTLAYQYTRPAPRTLRPRHNVCVRLCSIECCFLHPLSECDTLCSFSNREHGDSFQKDLADWARVCDRLYVWDYVVNFHHYVNPFPNFRVLAPNIRYFIEHNVKGIFEEGATTVYGGAEFAELRAYVLAKLLWDPSLDTDQLVREFMFGYYGLAGAPLYEYYVLLHERAHDNPERHFGIYDMPRIEYLTPAVVARAYALFERALALAGTEEIRRRVQIARLPILYWELLTAPKSPERKARIEAFFAELASLGIHEITEGQPIDKTRKEMEEGLQWRFS